MGQLDAHVRCVYMHGVVHVGARAALAGHKVRGELVRARAAHRLLLVACGPPPAQWHAQCTDEMHSLERCAMRTGVCTLGGEAIVRGSVRVTAAEGAQLEGGERRLEGGRRAGLAVGGELGVEVGVVRGVGGRRGRARRAADGDDLRRARASHTVQRSQWRAEHGNTWHGVRCWDLRCLVRSCVPRKTRSALLGSAVPRVVMRVSGAVVATPPSWGRRAHCPRAAASRP